MADKTRGSKIKYRFLKKWRRPAAALLALAVLLGGICYRYFLFMSQTVYRESTSHLSEILRKSDNMLNHLVSRNQMLLHLWNDFLKNASSEEQIRSSLNEMQKETGCAALYFLASDGSCMTQDGEKSSLGSQTDLDTLIFAGEDVVVNAVLPGKPQMLVFACPEMSGTYRGFAYDAIAIAYYNDTVLSAIDNSAFEGTSHNYVVYPDGRVVLDSEAVGENGSEESVYNFLAELRSSSNLSDKAFDALSDDFAQGRNGSLMLTLHGTRYYLVYENTGIQDWIMLSLVPVSVVNASMDTLWHRTVEIVTAIACLLMVLLIALIVHRSRDALRRRDTEILYRDELFTRLSRNVDDVFFMLDAETSRTDYVSPNIERLLGVPLEQVQQDIRALRALHPKDSPDHDKNFLAGIQCGEQSEWDADYAHQQTGERRWFHIVAMGSEVAGRTKYILVMSDRTADRKINQALSEAVAAAEAASRAKSTFLSNMSHDIRTPMNAIIGFTTLAVSNIDNQERVKDYLTKTLSSSRHLLALINDILDMSRIESGKLHLEETEVNLAEMLHDIKTIVSGQIYAKQLELYMDALDVADEDVYCDRTRLGQILLNLLSNAIKFTPAGGTVSVRIRQLAGTVRDCAQYEFRVRDNGIGMSPEFAQKIFEPFERERTSTVSRIQGTGLGMAITRNIVEMMGGTIKVQTEKNRGTEFIICLPLRVQTGSRREEKIAELAGLKALVVDDDFNTCDSVAKLLTRVGMRAEWTLSGREAVLRARQSIELGDPCRAYIIDWRLPDMNGIEVTRQIRSLNDDTPIIILTAYDWSDIEAEAKAAGVTAFCSKPMFLSDLRDTLLTAIGHMQTAEEQDILPGKNADFRGRHILLVEDNELNREIAMTILHEYGFLVDIAENGAVAVEKVRTSDPGRYDLVLMDVQMPVMDGYTATQRIRALKDPARAAVPIVAMTANVFEEERKQAFDCGMNGFLSKPIVVEELIDALKGIMH
jgi:two-component system sensor histidine kinase/response regulator